VVCTADVGDASQAQRNMNTKLVILPPGGKSRELVRAWLEGESKAPALNPQSSTLTPKFAFHKP
jgi:hypothetical protein